MSQKEVDRALVFDRVIDGQINLKQAAELMHLSYPQTKRLWSHYKEQGKIGLISKKRGIRSNRSVSVQRRKEIAQIISEKYFGCKPLFISEKLHQYHRINYSSEFIRQVMIEYHLWIPKKKRVKLHPRRQRRESEGELLQVDASDHAWFEGRGPRCHLHLFVDDATSKTKGGHFALGETTEGYFRALEPILEENGRPIDIYTDKRGVFVVNQGKNRGLTQFSRAMKELGINMILAHSPEAKGRIERAFGTLQERLVWEMRIHGINNIEEANRFLSRFFIEYNNKFAEKPSNPFNAYRPLDQNTELKYILCTKEERVVSKNLEVQWKNKIYQLTPPESLGLKLKNAKIIAITTLENEIAFEYQGRRIDYVPYNQQNKQFMRSREELLRNWKNGSGRKSKPSKHHPWKRSGTRHTAV